MDVNLGDSSSSKQKWTGQLHLDLVQYQHVHNLCTSIALPLVRDYIPKFAPTILDNYIHVQTAYELIGCWYVEISHETALSAIFGLTVYNLR